MTYIISKIYTTTQQDWLNYIKQINDQFVLFTVTHRKLDEYEFRIYYKEWMSGLDDIDISLSRKIAFVNKFNKFDDPENIQPYKHVDCNDILSYVILHKLCPNINAFHMQAITGVHGRIRDTCEFALSCINEDENHIHRGISRRASIRNERYEQEFYISCRLMEIAPLDLYPSITKKEIAVYLWNEKIEIPCKYSPLISLMDEELLTIKGISNIVKTLKKHVQNHDDDAACNVINKYGIVINYIDRCGQKIN